MKKSAGEDSWESLGQQGDQTNHKGNQLWIFIGRTDAEAEAQILWPPDGESQLIVGSKAKEEEGGRGWDC